MKITDIKVRKLIEDGRLRAVVSVTVDDELAIHDLKVIEGPERLFVAMPSRREAGGVFRDIVHPIIPSAREKLEEAVLLAYTREKARAEKLSDIPYGDYLDISSGDFPYEYYSAHYGAHHGERRGGSGFSAPAASSPPVPAAVT